MVLCIQAGNRFAWSNALTPINAKICAKVHSIISCIQDLVDKISIYVREIFISHHPRPVRKSWKPRRLPINIAMAKMWKNSQKAIKEHISKSSSGYATSNEALPGLPNFKKTRMSPFLNFSWTSAERQGLRDSMEDAHFCFEFGEGFMAGVFDGHGGKEVSAYTSTAFQNSFPKALQESRGNVHQAFEALIYEINAEVFKRNEWHRTGSTAAVCYVDKGSGIIYTATLGDSEANVYRLINGQTKSIPLSCVRDWSCKSDAQRAAIALNRPEIAKKWPLNDTAYKIRFPHAEYGLNVSRAIGDKKYAMCPEKPGVSPKPKITVNLLKKSDILIIACDGLKDYVPEKEIAEIVHKHRLNPEGDLAKKLVNHAIDDRDSQDNVTVFVIKIT